jgi:hypothetical protein
MRNKKSNMKGLRRKWFQKKEEKEKDQKEEEEEEEEGMRRRTDIHCFGSLPSKRKTLFCYKTEADSWVADCLKSDFVDCKCQCKFHCQGHYRR